MTMIKEKCKRPSFLGKRFRLHYRPAVNDNKLPRFIKIKKGLIILTIISLLCFIIFKITF